MKCHNEVLAKIKDDISFESFIDLRNSALTGLTDLFPKDAVEKAIVKSSRVLHDEAIHKVVTQGKPAKKPPKVFAVLETIIAF